MSFKILHILDVFIPETMNWLENLLEESKDVCEHHIFASYYIRSQSNQFHYVNAGLKTDYPLPLAAKVKARWQQPKNSKILFKYIQDNNIQLIHFHFGHVAIKFKQLINSSGLPFCISLYGFDYEYLVYKNPKVKTDYLFLAKFGGRFIVEGNYSKKILENYGIPVQQIEIVHMLYDRKFAGSSHKYMEPIRLFQAATFTEKKNQLGLVEALQDRHAGRFVIAFYGEKHDKQYYKELKSIVKGKNKHCIHMHDKLSFADYLNALDTAHFTVNLSKRSHDQDTEGGCPVLLKDSLNLGKPGISTNHCDIPELIVHECNGFLLPENDTQSVTELLDYLLLIPQNKYSRYCTNALESVNTNIAQKMTRNDLLNVYQAML